MQQVQYRIMFRPFLRRIISWRQVNENRRGLTSERSAHQAILYNRTVRGYHLPDTTTSLSVLIRNNESGNRVQACIGRINEHHTRTGSEHNQRYHHQSSEQGTSDSE